MLKNESENNLSLNHNPSFLSTNDNNQKLLFISKKAEEKERDQNNINNFLKKKHDKFLLKNNVKGRWTKEEQILFVDMILELDGDWKQIKNKFATRTIVQIRSHAQKFLMKLKNNSYLREKGLQKCFSWNKTIYFLKSVLTIEEIKQIFYSLCEAKKKKKEIKIQYDNISNSNLNDSQISNENKNMNLIIDENNNIDNNSENNEGIFEDYFCGKFKFEDCKEKREYFKNQNKYIEQFFQNFNYNTISDNDESSNEKMDLFIRKKIINEESYLNTFNW